MKKQTKYARALERQELIDSLNEDGKYIVRQYDWFDHIWFDLTGELSKDQAVKEWDKKTKKGTKNAKFEDGDYYHIFSSDTKMIFS